MSSLRASLGSLLLVLAGLLAALPAHAMGESETAHIEAHGLVGFPDLLSGGISLGRDHWSVRASGGMVMHGVTAAMHLAWLAPVWIRGAGTGLSLGGFGGLRYYRESFDSPVPTPGGATSSLGVEGGGLARVGLWGRNLGAGVEARAGWGAGVTSRRMHGGGVFGVAVFVGTRW